MLLVHDAGIHLKYLHVPEDFKCLEAVSRFIKPDGIGTNAEAGAVL